MLSAADVDAAAGYAPLAILPIPLLAGLARFARAPDRKSNERERNLLASTLVGLNVVVILALALDRGLT
jgi:hypothetical protein